MGFPDDGFMRMALRLARKGVGRTSPNPAVGAVLVRGGEVVGSGFHRAAGMPHAEVEAIRAAGGAARGSDLYVTLEPCAYAGRTGPCTEAIMDAGIRRVAAAMRDPNPRVSGRGFRALRAAGLSVATGVLEEEARALNRPYCRWIVSGRPYVTLKMAVSLDGKAAAASGESRWITSERPRRLVHRMRSESDAVLVGGGTFRADSPRLTARIRGGRNPRRVILTSRIEEVAGKAAFLAEGGEVIVAAPEGAARKAAPSGFCRGIRVLSLPARRGRVDADAFLEAVGKEGIASLLVEGGGRTAGWLVEAGAVDRFVFFIAPLLLGDGVPSVTGFAVRRLREGRRLSITRVAKVGQDVMVVAERAPVG